MTKSRVFVTRRIAHEALDMISSAADMELWGDPLPPPRDVLLNKIHAAEGLLSLLTDKIDSELMDAAPKAESGQ